MSWYEGGHYVIFGIEYNAASAGTPDRLQRFLIKICRPEIILYSVLQGLYDDWLGYRFLLFLHRTSSAAFSLPLDVPGMDNLVMDSYCCGAAVDFEDSVAACPSPSREYITANKLAYST